MNREWVYMTQERFNGSEREFAPKPISSVEAIERLKHSTFRATELARRALESADEEPLIRLRAEKVVYLDCLKRLREAVLNGGYSK